MLYEAGARQRKGIAAINRFVTRIELHDANWRGCENLHAYMAALKFHRTIVGDNGVTCELPSATYSSEGPLSALQVRELASIAAATTGRRYWVLVTEGLSCWQLRPVNALSPLASVLLS